MASVLFEEKATHSGKKFGVARLNSEKSLNALSLDMIRLLLPQLNAWQSDDSIACVMLEGAGSKAFCAGGDVVSLYKAMKKGDALDDISTFFIEEYRLDHLIHTYQKPILTWGNGIIMGGGLGLVAGASHRVVTETARIAMPEITIGLFPDVGGSYFLNKMPEGVGLFLGLTGAPLNANDALTVNLADHFVSSADKDALMEALLQANWQSTASENHTTLTDVLAQFSGKEDSAPSANVAPHLATIAHFATLTRVSDVVDTILALESDDKWLLKAQASLKHGSPLSAHLVFEQLSRAKHLSLAECFQMEAVMARRAGEFGEFQEGVRALLIDKDGEPHWQFSCLDSVSQQAVSSFFKSPWQPHPLADLSEGA